ncbi:hypothetical protein [Paraburkholderia fungorum]|uniref:hypothetical protein n=1 Tax=Paraburkholderia fungorum TaxID=134537 RepID=UPI0038780CEC
MEIIVETYVAHGEPSSARLRARPLPGQGVDTSLHVECSRAMRHEHPAGSLFRLVVKRIYRKGTPLLYARPTEQFELVSEEEAQRFISTMYDNTGRKN